MKKILLDIKDSFYNPAFYSNIKDVKGRKPVLLIILITFLSVLIFMAPLFPKVLDFAESVKTSDVKKHFPSELEITVEDGLASSNIEGPYYFGEIPEENRSEKDPKTYAVLVDTTSDYTLSELRDVDAYTIITKDAVLGEQDNELRAYYHSDIFENNDFTLNQKTIEGWLQAISGWVTPLLVTLYILAIGIATVSFSVSWFFLAIVFSLVTMAIAVMRKREMKYGLIYKTTLYALVPIIIISIFFPALPIWIKLLMFIIILWKNIEAPVSVV
jgi:hypothetical protein